ncbi:unnamed protein product [Caenorhabditis sp. 36 PRJEB53466]|nr:unnamed protein product [Caenorhabditis sp. 36 PRJEB53466]
MPSTTGNQRNEAVESLSNDIAVSFVPSVFSDAVLVVQGKKIHVNKVNLSHQSAIFAALFAVRRDEYRLERPDFLKLALLLGTVNHRPIPTAHALMSPENGKHNCEKLLEEAEIEKMPFAISYIKMFDQMRESGQRARPKRYKCQMVFEELGTEKMKFLEKNLREYFPRRDRTPLSAFRKNKILRALRRNFGASERNNTILRVGDQQLHVNKEFMRYHSEFLATRFEAGGNEFDLTDAGLSYIALGELLSLLYPNPAFLNFMNALILLQHAKTFKMRVVCQFLEDYLRFTKEMKPYAKWMLYDWWEMHEMRGEAVNSVTTIAELNQIKIAISISNNRLADISMRLRLEVYDREELLEQEIQAQQLL